MDMIQWIWDNAVIAASLSFLFGISFGLLIAFVIEHVFDDDFEHLDRISDEAITDSDYPPTPW